VINNATLSSQVKVEVNGHTVAIFFIKANLNNNLKPTNHTNPNWLCRSLWHASTDW